MNTSSFPWHLLRCGLFTFVPPCSVGHHLLSQLSCISTFHSNYLNSHHSQQEKIPFASSFTVFIQLLRTVKLKQCSIPQDEGMGRNNSPWNRLAVYLSAALCNLPGNNTYTPLNSSSSNTPDVLNSCSEVSALMRTEAITHCTGCMQVLRHGQLPDPPCSGQNLSVCELNIPNVQNLLHL